ncbi:MAG: peptidylprolyl isomerase [Crocinitomicaceae bacterium]
MAVIGKIQKNSVLLLIVIGGAMLAFIFTDLMKGGGGDEEYIPLATVYGEEVDVDEYEELREVYINREKNNTIQQGREFTKEMEKQAEEQAFNEVIRRNLMNREFEKAGIVCTTEELNDMIHGDHIHPWVEQIPIFKGRDGQFSRDSVRVFITNLEMEPPSEEARVQWLEARSQWKAFEQELKDTRKADKYVTLIKNGLYVNSIEAEHQYRATNEIRAVRFVIQRYSDIPRDEIEVTDEDIKVYYEEHKEEKKYEMQESRDVAFVTFDIQPSAEDMEILKKDMEELKSSFAKSDNNLAFMQKHSASQFSSDSAEYRMGTTSLAFDSMFGNSSYPAVADEAVQNAEIGDVIGPFPSINPQTQKEEMFIAKVTGLKKEKQAWVRHILIKTDASRSEEQAKAKADSLINVIQSQGNFVEMVQKFSEDPGSIVNNGEYKWFAEGRMVTEFNDAAFNGAIGKLQLVKTTYGYHIVEVLGRADRKVPKLAVVTKKVKPSENTLKYMEETVFDYIYSVNQSEDDSAFYSIASDSGLTVNNTRIWINQTNVTGIDNPRKIMKFAFGRNALEGNISDPILDGEQYVVAYLANVINKGVPEFEDVKEQMRFPALKDKQAEVYMAKMAGKSSLAEVSKIVTKGQILNAQITFGANVIAGGGGNEPEVIGKLFTEIPPGAMTKPLKGRTGVYVCILDEITEAPETSDYSQVRENVQIARRQASDNLVIRALREKAEVEDNRKKKEYR